MTCKSYRVAVTDEFTLLPAPGELVEHFPASGRILGIAFQEIGDWKKILACLDSGLVVTVTVETDRLHGQSAR